MNTKRPPFSDVPSNDGVGRKRQLEPPSMMDHSKPSALYRTKYQQKLPPKVDNRGTSSTNHNNAEVRARLYKAEAYEAKIRIASQEQRMNSLQQELDELRFFEAVEKGIAIENPTKSHNDPPPSTDEDPMSGAAEKDAELIECLATELEDMEKDLKQVTRQLKEERSKNLSLAEEAEMHSKTKLKLENMQDELAAVKAKNESLSEEISLLAVRRKSNDEWQIKEAAWQSKEAILNKAIEDKQAELKKSKKNNVEVANTLREIEGAVVGLQQELDAEKLKNQALSERQISATAASVDNDKWNKREAELIKKIDRQQKELNKWKKDTSDGVIIMKELEAALRKARTENKDLRSIIEESKDAANNSSQLEKELACSQNERDEALRNLSSLRHEHSRLLEQSRGDTSKYEELVKSNEELKGVLVTTQSQLENEVELMRKDLTQTEELKEKLERDFNDLRGRFDQQKKETDDLANSFEEQKIDLGLRSSELEELKELHEASLEKHASELKASKLLAESQTKEISSLQQTYKSQMLIFQSQIEALRESAIRNSDGPDDEIRAEIDNKLRFAQAQIEGIDSHDESGRLQKEIFTLRSHVASAEGRESRLKQQMLLLSEELSETDAAYKKQISDLQAELDEMRAFGLSPRYNNVPLETRDAESNKDLEKERKQIEFDALQDYVTQWQAFDP